MTSNPGDRRVRVGVEDLPGDKENEGDSRPSGHSPATRGASSAAKDGAQEDESNGETKKNGHRSGRSHCAPSSGPEKRAAKDDPEPQSEETSERLNPVRERHAQRSGLLGSEQSQPVAGVDPLPKDPGGEKKKRSCASSERAQQNSAPPMARGQKASQRSGGDQEEHVELRPTAESEQSREERGPLPGEPARRGLGKQEEHGCDDRQRQRVVREPADEGAEARKRGPDGRGEKRPLSREETAKESMRDRDRQRRGECRG